MSIADRHSPSVSGSRAARAPQRIAAHAKLEARALLTNGEQLMVSLMLPAMVLLGLRFIPVSPALFGGHTPSISDAVAATAVTAIIATSLTSQAISTGFDRRNGVLRWIATTPLGRGGYMLGKLGALSLVHILQIVVLGVLSLALGWRPTASEILWSIPAWILATCAFGGLGLLIAGTLRTEAVLALSNIFFLLFIAVGGVAIPAKSFPAPLDAIVALLPSAAATNALTAALSGHAPSLWSLALLAIWAALFGGLTVRFFRWTSS
ncbi:DrrB family ABC transporter efflux protein [Dermabacter vaginalis]|uniref:DrrB family ABC transporter efflux protein n=1 Tax=Dermabacter vaginalis TaxID=1630135 RepID=A0A1B0ZIC1_9MICO|nr:ABC transporter permease [Dermabacter vaginalis]ANP27739.1 DrrB family ABC transporter efflux protein [Dermabacter vaginalis]